MKINKNFKFLFFVLLFLGFPMFAYAQPPFQEIISDSQYLIETPLFRFHEINTDYLLHAHVINSTSGAIITNETAYCFIHLYNINGSHILQKNMSFDNNGIEFELLIGASNFTTINENWFILQCQNYDNKVGGIISGNYYVTETGKSNLERRNITYIIIGLAVIMLFYLILAIPSIYSMLKARC